jgi:hypothetical protein
MVLSGLMIAGRIVFWYAEQPLPHDMPPFCPKICHVGTKPLLDSVVWMPTEK